MRSAVLLAALGLAGCATAADLSRPPFAPAPDDVARVASDADAVERLRLPPASLPASGGVTLEHVLALAEEMSPAVAAALSEVDAATGRAWQAGLHPNPSLTFSREGPFDRRPWGNTQFLVGARQPVVVSDRRRLAADAELADRDVRKIAVADVRRAVRGEARTAFVDLVALRDLAALRAQLLASAQELLDLARSRVDAKVAVEPEALKPELEVLTLRAELAADERRRDAARDRLRALLGGVAVPVERLTAAASAHETDLALLVRRAMERHPALLAARSQVDAAQRRLELARTASRPDIEVEAAVGRDFEGDDFVAEIGVEIPLAVFDAGQGAIHEARALVAKARRDVESMERAVAAEITLRFGEAEAARAQVRELRERIVPLAERTLAATRDGYRAGTQEFLDVLDAQRTLLEARAAVLAAERDVALADAELVNLTGDTP